MIRKILIPTDFSTTSVHAFKYAIDLNSGFKARLYLLNVLQEFTDFAEFNLSPSILPQLYAEFEENATQRLEDMTNNLVPEGMICDTYLIHGTPFYEIVQFAEREQVDLIVIGTHGRTGLKKVIFGSTAAKVIQKASCPVLSVRHPEDTDKTS